MKNMKKIIVIGCCLSLFVTAMAQQKPQISVNGLTYRVDIENRAVEVVSAKDSITDVIIPQAITFRDNTLEVIGIGDSAFYNHNNLRSVTIGESVRRIGSCAFLHCDSLTSITSLISNPLGSEAANIKEVSFSYDAFDDNVYLYSNLYVPKYTPELYKRNASFKRFFGIKVMGNFAQVDSVWYELKPSDGYTATVINNPQKCYYAPVNDVEYYTSSPRVLNIPTSISVDGTTYRVTTIGKDAFKNANLSSIFIPNGIDSIAEGAFMNSRQKEAVMPNTIKTIGEGAFANYLNPYDRIYSYIVDAKRWLKKGWGPTTTVDTLYVPLGTGSDYEAIYANSVDSLGVLHIVEFDPRKHCHYPTEDPETWLNSIATLESRLYSMCDVADNGEKCRAQIEPRLNMLAHDAGEYQSLYNKIPYQEDVVLQKGEVVLNQLDTYMYFWDWDIVNVTSKGPGKVLFADETVRDTTLALMGQYHVYGWGGEYWIAKNMFVPDNNEVSYKVFCHGEEMSLDALEEGQAGIMYGDGDLVVEFTSSSTSITKPLQQGDFTVSAYGGVIRIEGRPDCRLFVYRIDGSLVGEYMTNSQGNANIPVGAKGCYIVKIGANTRKLNAN